MEIRQMIFLSWLYIHLFKLSGPLHTINCCMFRVERNTSFLKVLSLSCLCPQVCRLIDLQYHQAEFREALYGNHAISDTPSTQKWYYFIWHFSDSVVSLYVWYTASPTRRNEFCYLLSRRKVLIGYRICWVWTITLLILDNNFI